MFEKPARIRSDEIDHWTGASFKGPARHVLRALSSLSSLSSEDLQSLDRLLSATKADFSPGDELVVAGSEPEYLNIVLSGWACCYKALSNGGTQATALAIAGDTIEIGSLLLDRTDQSVRALTPIQVARIPRPLADRELLAHPRISRALYTQAAGIAAVHREWLVNLGQRDGSTRLAHLFCEIFFRMRAVDLADRNTCEIPLRQYDLGEALGFSTVHVNRLMQELRAAGLIQYAFPLLRIPSIEALIEHAGFDPLYLQHGGRDLHIL